MSNNNTGEGQKVDGQGAPVNANPNAANFPEFYKTVDPKANIEEVNGAGMNISFGPPNPNQGAAFSGLKSTSRFMVSGPINPADASPNTNQMAQKSTARFMVSGPIDMNTSLGPRPMYATAVAAGVPSEQEFKMSSWATYPLRLRVLVIGGAILLVVIIIIIIASKL
eukprot:TRINITY_DN6043_c0_g1_i4.p1 TRINITY_DN6043_c0_g1~~TRINITY_DN6043_c0_g1_i4.p1  ORF type:complete len:167 (+),score=10.57 TRINITY_DN6043_c0_g1_i4:143-643(+)